MVSSAKHAHFTSFGKMKILYRVYIFSHMQQLQFSSQCIHWVFIWEQIGYRKTICITFIAFLVYETLSLKRNFRSTGKSISKFIDIVLNFLFSLNPLIQIRHTPPPITVSFDTIIRNISSSVKIIPLSLHNRPLEFPHGGAEEYESEEREEGTLLIERRDAPALEEDHAQDLDVVRHGDREAEVLKEYGHRITREHKAREKEPWQKGRDAHEPRLQLVLRERCDHEPHRKRGEEEEGRERIEEQHAPAQGHAEHREGNENTDRRLDVAKHNIGQNLADEQFPYMQRRYKELLKCARLALAHDGHGDHDHHRDREDDAHECGQHVVGGDGIGIVPRADAHVVGRRCGGRSAHSDGLHPHAKPRQGGDGRGRGDGVRGIDNRLDRHRVPRICLPHEIGRKDNADLCITALDPLVQLIVAPRDAA